jgi:hypothetical protein
MQPSHVLIATACLALAACMVPMPEPVSTGAEDFATYCAVCHGDGGKGDGALASTLDRRPADLTRLAARNGGVFPATRAMSKIWGYADGRDGGRVMPSFGPLLEGGLMPYDGGDGILTPTPIRLVQLTEYVKSIQEF